MLSSRAMQGARALQPSAQHMQSAGAAPHEAAPHASAPAHAHADPAAGLVPMSSEEVRVVEEDEFEAMDVDGGETRIVEVCPAAGSEAAAGVAPGVLQTSLWRAPSGAEGNAMEAEEARPVRARSSRGAVQVTAAGAIRAADEEGIVLEVNTRGRYVGVTLHSWTPITLSAHSRAPARPRWERQAVGP